MDHSGRRDRIAFDANPDEDVWAAFDTLAFEDLPTRIKFDTMENALWVGTETGFLSSHFQPGWEDYSMFRAHNDEIVNIFPEMYGVLCVGLNGISIHSRGGLLQWRSPLPLPTINCCEFSNQMHSNIALGSETDISIFDLAKSQAKQKISITSPASAIAVERMICVGDQSGVVSFIDSRSFKKESQIEAITGSVIDIAVRDDIVMICGTHQEMGMEYANSSVELYDLRMFSQLGSLRLPGASFVVANSIVPTHCFVVSNLGHFQMFDLQRTIPLTPIYQVETDSEIISVDFSPSGECMACSDRSGVVHMWSQLDDFSVIEQESAQGMTFPPPLRSLHSNFGEITEFDPYCDVVDTETEMLSHWSESLSFQFGIPPRKILPSILSDVKQNDFIGYARNPGIKSSLEGYESLPLLVSTQDPSTGGSRGKAMIVTEGGSERKVPDDLRFTEITHDDRAAWEEFDFKKYNITEFVGIENILPNSYTNACLQALYFTSPLRQYLENHICSRPSCIACELSFLFHMMSTQKGGTCHAGNFLRNFRLRKECLDLGLVLKERLPVFDKSRMLTLVRFFLKVLNEELSTVAATTDGEEKDTSSPIRFLFGVSMKGELKRVSDGLTQKLSEELFIIDLMRSAIVTSLPPIHELLNSTLTSEMTMRVQWSDSKSYEVTTKKRLVHKLPPFLALGCSTLMEDAQFLHALLSGSKDGRMWIPEKFSYHFETALNSYVFDAIGSKTGERSGTYALKALIFRVDGGNEHYVSYIRVSEDRWVLFNDFVIRDASFREAVTCDRWKIPSILLYEVEKMPKLPCLSEDSKVVAQIDKSVYDAPPLKRPETLSFIPLDDEEMSEGMRIALDAEFVALRNEEAAFEKDGRKHVKRPPLLSLARVSVVRGEPGERFGEAFLDDYIHTEEHVDDFLTQYSGVVKEDLDPEMSDKYLTTLKDSYLKLRYLVDRGCIIIGHGLAQDFRIINMHVPPEQVRDTAEIYRKADQRKISLRFLAKNVLHRDIQQTTHDSIEDAQTALYLFTKYEELMKSGTFEEVLEDVYAAGRSTNWQ